ncbi:MAG: DNA starvation/stationary phase protection protein [Dialister sp.]|nr:DNA starvation/stationary phase protection protein [Dialister sp.]
MMEKKLNVLRSDLVVFYHKLQSYHWYLKGYHFFDDHEQLEKYYDEIAEAIDAVAEIMMQLELKPESTVKGFLAATKIEEAKNREVSSEEVYKAVLSDFKYLLSEVISVKEGAEKDNNYLGANLMDDYIDLFSKNIWMARQVLK